MFVLSKLVGVVLQPGNLALVVLAFGLVLLFGRRHRLGRAIIGGAVAVLLAMAVLPWESWLLGPLEERFPPLRELPEKVDGIVVLGGAVDPVMSASRGEASIGSAAERVLALMELGRRYPAARLVYTGGSGAVLAQAHKEAPVVRRLLDSVGFDTARVVFEDQSRNTRENALFSKQMVSPRPGETWLLVTSAAHMPRAVGTFRAVGWPVTAYPVDYGTAPEGEGLRFSVAGGLSAVGGALHEWLGLVYYHRAGWSDALYPSP